MILDYAKYALGNFKKRKLRTLLTLIGIFIGIAAVVSLLSLGQGLQKSINEQFEMLGIDKIIITPEGSFLGLPAAEGPQLTDSDLDKIKKINGVKTAGSMLYKIAKVESRNEIIYTFATGLPQDDSKEVIESMSSFKVKYGRELKKTDKYKALAGIRLSQDNKVFKNKLVLGDTIKIEDKNFQVVGFLDTIGNPQDDSQFLIPLDAAREIFNEPKKVDAIIAQAQPGLDINSVADRIKKELRKFRNVKEDEEDFEIQTSAQLLETFSAVFLIVQVVLIGIAAISLLVGGIGIMNTMYTSVLQRTRDIGIMKAIGAKNSDILLIFLIESGILGLVGGAVGILIGVALSKLVEFASFQSGITLFQAYFPWYLIVGALAFSFIVGVLSGILPARQASKLKPVDALRYE